MKLAKIITSIILLSLGSFLASCACHGIQDPVIRKANGVFLSEKSSIPTKNYYKYVPGCYVACYSENSSNNAFATGRPGIYGKGLVRVNGLYVGPVCQPQGYAFKTLYKIQHFSDLCNQYISTCHGNCFGNGETGKFVGITNY